MFFSVGSVIAASLVPLQKAGRAIAIMFTGLTIALVTGGPIGTFISQELGWRAAFLSIAVTGLIALITILAFLPRNLEIPSPSSFLSQFEVLLKPQFILIFLITTIGHCGSFVAFTYLAEILRDITGYAVSSVGLLFVFYGIGVTFGNGICARYADKNGPSSVLLKIYTILSLSLFSLYYFSTSKILMIPIILLWGATAFGNVPVLQLYIVQTANSILPHTKEAASSMNIAAFNVGIASGAYLGGIVVDHLGLHCVGLAAAAVVALNVPLVFLSSALNRK